MGGYLCTSSLPILWFISRHSVVLLQQRSGVGQRRHELPSVSRPPPGPPLSRRALRLRGIWPAPLWLPTPADRLPYRRPVRHAARLPYRRPVRHAARVHTADLFIALPVPRCRGTKLPYAAYALPLGRPAPRRPWSVPADLPAAASRSLAVFFFAGASKWLSRLSLASSPLTVLRIHSLTCVAR